MSDHPDTGAAGAEPEKAPVSTAPVLPGRIDVAAALRTYVRGRSRAIAPERKRELAETTRPDRKDAGSGPPVAPLRLPSFPPGPGSPAAPRLGVPVPARLVFHRSAGLWRARAPGQGESRPPSDSANG